MHVGVHSHCYDSASLFDTPAPMEAMRIAYTSRDPRAIFAAARHASLHVTASASQLKHRG